MFPRAVTIAGSDSGGGAGIQADLKTFTVLGVYGTSVITSLTAQNTLGVHGIADVAPDFVLEQLRAVASDIGADAIKTGMLSQVAIVEKVAEGLGEWFASRNIRRKNRGQARRHEDQTENFCPNAAEPVPVFPLPLVVDPVMIAKSGYHLLQDDAVGAVVSLLFPQTALLTPNAFEAEMLTRLAAESDAQAQQVAEALLAMGPRAVLLKGGHRGAAACDDLYMDQSGRVEWLRGERLAQRHTHGTGCTLSAAITAYLARGMEMLEACRAGKRFIAGAIAHAMPLGQGIGPVNHLWECGGFAKRA